MGAGRDPAGTIVLVPDCGTVLDLNSEQGFIRAVAGSGNAATVLEARPTYGFVVRR